MNGAMRVGGFWGFLAYAQNFYINAAKDNIGSSSIADPVNTIIFGDSDGWDSCLYPDTNTYANVCYRHSGGNEKGSGYDHGVKGPAAKKGRANVAFVDGHVELRRDAPLRLFTLERD
jgi:prepilin-type processing-associated H-X9-DG protein